MALAEISLHGSEKPLPLALIAHKQALDVQYLEQIFSKLRQAGLVRSVRGPGGGYVLNNDMAKITIAEIMLAMGENMKMTRCNNAKKGCMPNTTKCLTHDLWAALDANINAFLYSVNLADVINGNILKSKNNDIS